MKKILVFACLLVIAGNLMSQITVTFNVDMTDAVNFNPLTEDVYISGDFASWPQPGSDLTLMMTPSVGNPMIYTLNIQLAGPQTIMYKYFLVINNNPSWDNGEWPGGPNRMAIITGEVTLDDIWADIPVSVTFVVDMTGADPFDPDHDDVYIAGTLANNWSMPGTIPEYKLSPVSGNEMFYSINLQLYQGYYAYKYFRVIDSIPSWDHGEWDGDPSREITVTGTMIEEDVWGLITSVKPAKPGVSFSIAPNPVENRLNIGNLGSIDKIEILNSAGILVLTIDNIDSPSISLRTTGLSKGFYLVKVYQGKTVQTGKFMKK